MSGLRFRVYYRGGRDPAVNLSAAEVDKAWSEFEAVLASDAGAGAVEYEIVVAFLVVDHRWPLSIDEVCVSRFSKKEMVVELEVPVDVSRLGRAISSDEVRAAVRQAVYLAADELARRGVRGGAATAIRQLERWLNPDGATSPAESGASLEPTADDQRVPVVQRSVDQPDWLEDGVDEWAPFGSDEGSDAVGLFREWRERHPVDAVIDVVGQWLSDVCVEDVLSFAAPDFVDLERRLRVDEEFQLEEFSASAGVLAIAVGQRLDEGRVDADVERLAQVAIARLRVWSGVITSVYDSTADGDGEYQSRLDYLSSYIAEPADQA